MKIGLLLPLEEDLERGGPATYRELRDLALRAEAAGFDSVWVYDHLLFRYPGERTRGVQECWSILGGLAEATSRVELGTLVMPASWRNPALLAKMAVTMDDVSNGRLILGLGTGSHQPEFDAFGYPFDHRVDRFEEALQVIVPLLRQGKVDFQGTYVSASNAELRPRGPRPDGIPILIASHGPRMLRLTAQYASAWNIAWFGPVDGIAELRANLEQACADVGRDPHTLDVTVGVHIAHPESGVTESIPIDRSQALTGTPEEVATGLLAYRDAGVSHVICGALAHVTYDYTAHVLTHLADALKVYRARA